MFEPRLVRPEAGNKFYITKSAGGYSPCIVGKPTDKGCNVLANCVGYALGRFHEIAGRTEFDLIQSGNAENLIERAKTAGLRTGALPELGAIIVWQKGPTLSGSDGAGHCAIVEEVGIGGDITTSESGYNASKPFWTAHYKAPYRYRDGYTFRGFIYQPARVQRTLRKGDRGDDVRAMQDALAAAKYLRAGECDGDFGVITLGAVCAYQLEHGLDVDGVCGPATRATLKI